MTTGFKFNPFTGNFDIVTTSVDLSTTDVSGILPETRGGTNQSTYTTGDILYASASNTLSKLPASTDGYVLTLASGVPTWAPGGGAANYAISSSSGAFSSSSASYVDIPNLTVTITTTGRPVILMLIPDGSGNPAFLDAQNASGSAGVQFNFVRASTVIAENSLSWGEGGVTITALDVEIPVSAHMTFDPVAAGTYTYKMQGLKTGGTLQVNYAKLVAYEI